MNLWLVWSCFMSYMLREVKESIGTTFPAGWEQYTSLWQSQCKSIGLGFALLGAHSPLFMALLLSSDSVLNLCTWLIKFIRASEYKLCKSFLFLFREKKTQTPKQKQTPDATDRHEKISSEVGLSISDGRLSVPYSINHRLSPCKCSHFRYVSSTAVGTVSPYQPPLPFWWSFIYLDFSLIWFLFWFGFRVVFWCSGWFWRGV